MYACINTCIGASMSILNMRMAIFIGEVHEAHAKKVLFKEGLRFWAPKAKGIGIKVYTNVTTYESSPVHLISNASTLILESSAQAI